MRKILFVGALSFAFCCGAFVSQDDAKKVKAEDAWSETLVGKAMGYYYAKAQLEGKDTYVSSNGKYEYFICHGLVENLDFAKFDTLSATSVSTYSLKSSISTDPSMTNWQTTTCSLTPDVEKIVFGFRAISPISWNAKQTQLGGWVTDSIVKFYVHRAGEALPTLIASQEFTKSNDVMNGFDAITLKAGDIGYYEWGKKSATTSTRNMQTSQTGGTGYPEFVVGSPAIDETKYYSEWLLSNSVASLIAGKGSTFDHEFISGGLYHGSPKNYEEFTEYYGDGTGGSTDSLATSKNTNLHLARFQRWQVNCGTADDAIVKLTAKKNMLMKTTYSIDSESGVSSWADKCSIRFYLMSSSGDLHFVKSAKVVVGNQGKNGEYDFSANLKAGESIFISITSDTDAYQTINYRPVIAVSEALYDASKTYDFDAANELEAYKILMAYTNGKKARWQSDSKFSPTEMLPRHYSGLQTIYLSFCRQVDVATSIAEIDALYNEFLSEFTSFGDAAKFVFGYLHFTDYDPDLNNTEATGACKTYYGPAKAAYDALSSTAKNQIKNNKFFADAKARLAEWGGANGEIVFPDYVLNVFSSSGVKASSTSTIVMLACIGAIALLAVLSLRRARHEK